MSAVQFRKQLRAIPPYVPGMPLDEAKRRFGLNEVVKLASNECPLGPFPSVVSQMPSWAQECNRYPDNDCHDLLASLCQILNVSREEILIGNGSAEIIGRTALALLEPGDEIVITWPTFPYYEIAAQLAGATARKVPMAPNYHYDLEGMLAAIGARTKLLAICNPNNPTGTYVPERELRSFLDAVPRNVLVVADEAYFEYTMAEDYATVLPDARRRENLLVTRTFSKIYGLAGLRIGYAVTNSEVAAQIRKAQGPFSVNTLAQMAAVESLRHPELVEDRKRLNSAWKKALCDGLASQGYPFAESEANFVMTKLGDNSETLFTEFVRRGVIIRPATSDGWMRVTVGTLEENQRFLRALEDLRLPRP